MKATTFIAILLTFLMAILVLVAALTFLLQGRQKMMDAADAAATSVAALEVTRVQLEANQGAVDAERATTVANLGTAQAEVVSLQGQLIQSDQAATAALATALAPAPTASPDPQTLAPPTVEILSPLPDRFFQVGDLVPIAFTVYHPAGLSGVQLSVESVAERQELETPPVSGEPYQRFDVDYDLGAEIFDVTQSIVISVVATSTLNVPSEEKLVTITVSVPTPEPTTSPTTAPSTPTTPAPTSTPESSIDSPAWIVGLPNLLEVGLVDTRQTASIERS